MKQLLTSKALRKLLILSCLVAGLVFVAASDNMQTVSAAPCCSSCPGGGDPVEADNACAAECGAASGTCFDDCKRRANNCYRVCIFCGGGGFDDCVYDTQCPPGSFCVNNRCS